MSFAFQKHHFDLSEYEFCETCSAPIVEVDRERECLFEWLKQQCLTQKVVDIVPLPNEIPEDEWKAVGIVLENGFMLPVDIACLDYDLDRIVTVNERLIGLEVVDATWIVGNTDGQLISMACEVDLSTPLRKHVVALSCNIDILMYMLTDDLFRRVEPS